MPGLNSDAVRTYAGVKAAQLNRERQTEYDKQQLYGNAAGALMDVDQLQRRNADDAAKRDAENAAREQMRKLLGSEGLDPSLADGSPEEATKALGAARNLRAQTAMFQGQAKMQGFAGGQGFDPGTYAPGTDPRLLARQAEIDQADKAAKELGRQMGELAAPVDDSFAGAMGIRVPVRRPARAADVYGRAAKGGYGAGAVSGVVDRMSKDAAATLREQLADEREAGLDRRADMTDRRITSVEQGRAEDRDAGRLSREGIAAADRASREGIAERGLAETTRNHDASLELRARALEGRMSPADVQRVRTLRAIISRSVDPDEQTRLRAEHDTILAKYEGTKRAAHPSGATQTQADQLEAQGFRWDAGAGGWVAPEGR
jgi:hypothetical protein